MMNCRIHSIWIIFLLLSRAFMWGADLQHEASDSVIEVDRNVVYGNFAEPMHRADVYRLSSLSKTVKSPGILMIHGGAWFTGDKLNDALHAKRLAKLGFVVVAINYRLIPAHPFPGQLDDCNLALEWMNAQAGELGVNVEMLGAWGYSAGGHLAALLATNPKEGLPRLKAAVVGAAPCDLTRLPPENRLLVKLLGGTRGKYPDRYANASPVTHVSPDDPPIFLFHGSKDWLVPPVESKVMRDALAKNGVSFEYLVVENKAHLMTFLDSDAVGKSFLFLKERLSVVSPP
ncbi:MAG TPA: alpha/beta hydrolase [Pirellula sp.]|nr:alpha/beta hydrolase [Pirellula sp.]